MTVGQIVAAVRVGQSMVSAHLKRLAEVGFVLVEHCGTASLYRINDACVECFPTAADVVTRAPSLAGHRDDALCRDSARAGVTAWCGRRKTATVTPPPPALAGL